MFYFWNKISAKFSNITAAHAHNRNTVKNTE